jgi:hypothetical protein
MKILACGVERIRGTSKTGNAFDMCNLHALVPVENTAGAKVQIEGFGFKSMDIALDPAVMSQFAGVFSRGPAIVEVVTEARPNRGKMETTVVGVASVPKAA